MPLSDSFIQSALEKSTGIVGSYARGQESMVLYAAWGLDLNTSHIDHAARFDDLIPPKHRVAVDRTLQLIKEAGI